MTTLTFYNIVDNVANVISIHENLHGYSINYNNYAPGVFCVTTEDDGDPELCSMFNGSKKLGHNRYLLTMSTGGQHVIDIIDGKAEVRLVHEPTLDLVYGVMSSITFEDVDLDKLESIIRREGSKGVIRFFEAEVINGMDNIPYPITDALE